MRWLKFVGLCLSVVAMAVVGLIISFVLIAANDWFVLVMFAVSLIICMALVVGKTGEYYNQTIKPNL